MQKLEVKMASPLTASLIIIVVILTPAARSVLEQVNRCIQPWNNYYCAEQNGCIWRKLSCNGKKNPCKTNEFYCLKEDKCISNDKECNYKPDCINGADEHGCLKASSQFCDNHVTNPVFTGPKGDVTRMEDLTFGCKEKNFGTNEKARRVMKAFDISGSLQVHADGTRNSYISASYDCCLLSHDICQPTKSYTPFTNNTGGSLIGLTHQPVDCKKTYGFVRSFKIENNAFGDKIQYAVDCCNIHSKLLRGRFQCTDHTTAWQSDGKAPDSNFRPTYMLTHHPIDCKEDGYYVSKFHLKHDGLSKFRYEYTCCAVVPRVSPDLPAQ